MVRVFVKGGVWKNTEDEILKAAVQKYGKQQWARVASLLNRKTAKQAKARWYEWLDPSIRKVEWDRSEEEKLLHLAKLLPAQWRTIAPLVGRTATQCQEHYEYLLDQAATASASAAAGGEDDVAGTTTSVRQQTSFRPGQIDIAPETKPAKPDPVDMDEDELEMLQEARARLANTQGKKAKRKERERMLAQAKRLADLQKRRELKQAGLLSTNAKVAKKRKSSREIDLGIEIPFYKPTPQGFHDISAEQVRTNTIQKQRLQQINYQQINENMYRNRDAELLQIQKKKNLRLQFLEDNNKSYQNQQEKLKRQQEQEQMLQEKKNRPSLSLPIPTIPDTEYQRINKVIQQQQQQQNESLIMGGGSNVTQALLGDYTSRPLPTPMRNPNQIGNSGGIGDIYSTGSGMGGGGDGMSIKTSTTMNTKLSVMDQASNQLRQMEYDQTPLLLSGISAGLDSDDIDAMQQKQDDDDDQYIKKSTTVGNNTPMIVVDRLGPGGQTPGSTLTRDELGLNRFNHSHHPMDGQVVHDDTLSVGASTFASSTMKHVGGGSTTAMSANSAIANNTTTTIISLRELARQERRAAKRVRMELEAALSTLPVPQYEYELAIPPSDSETTTPIEQPMNDPQQPSSSSSTITEQDRADVEQEQLQELQRQAIRLYQQQTSVMKRTDLPRPTNIQRLLLQSDTSIMDKEEEDEQYRSGNAITVENKAKQLIHNEMLMLIQHDAYTHPITMTTMDTDKDSNDKKKKQKKRKISSSNVVQERPREPPVALETIPEDVLTLAKKEIQAEFNKQWDDLITYMKVEKGTTSYEEATKLIIQENVWIMTTGNDTNMIYLPELGWIDPHSNNIPQSLTNTNDDMILRSLQLEFETIQSAMQQLKKKNEKVESKLAVITGGYAKRAKGLEYEIHETMSILQKSTMDESVYQTLREQEIVGGQQRVKKLMLLIDKMKKDESILQQQYSDLMVAKRRKAIEMAGKK